MSDFVLSCCSTADKPAEFFAQRNIPYVCFNFCLDGKEYLDDLGKSVPFNEFYKRMKEGSMPTTSQVNVSRFIEFFEPFLSEGKDILHIAFSSGLSGTASSAKIAAGELSEKYPDRKIFVVDSLAASAGYGLLMDAAADMRDSGKTIDEVHTWAEENKLKLHHWFFVTNLMHLKRGGRVSAASAAVGTLLNISPLLNVDSEGRLIPRDKVRGKANVIKEIVNRMEKYAQGGLDYSGKCFISNSGCYEDARAVADLIEARFPKLNGKVAISDIGTVIGAHTGQGTVALFFFGGERGL